MKNILKWWRNLIEHISFVDDIRKVLILINSLVRDICPVNDLFIVFYLEDIKKLNLSY
jgi:hypothetical protein